MAVSDGWDTYMGTAPFFCNDHHFNGDHDHDNGDDNDTDDDDDDEDDDTDRDTHVGSLMFRCITFMV